MTVTPPPDPPLVSILIPAHNAQRWLGDTLESALAQTWPRVEIIVVDDGSTDRTHEIARLAAPRGVQVVAQANQGAAAARNRAFSLSRGDYIQWLDADDLLAPDKIEKQMEAAATAGPHTLLSSAWGAFAYRTSKAVFAPNALWSDLAPVEWLLLKIDQELSMQPLAWLVSRDLTATAGPWDTRLLGDDDGEYFCRVLRASNGVRFVAGARSFYRRAGPSLSYVGRSARKIEAQFLSIRLYLEHILALEQSDRVRRACLRLLQRYLIFFHPERPDLVEAAQQLAGSLGGRLELPHLPWKYAWIGALFGVSFAKRIQVSYNRMKYRLLVQWDRLLFSLKVN